MINIFRYKKLYKDYERRVQSYKEALTNLTLELSNIRDELEYVTESKKNLETKLKRVIKQLAEKEKLRRIYAGRVGGLKKQNNKLENEKQKMLDLINNLIKENKKFKRNKKKPNIEELKKYFNK